MLLANALQRSREINKGKTPTLLRFWQKREHRYKILLRAAKWRKGLLLIAEAPLVFSGPTRRLTKLMTNEDAEENNVEKESADHEVVRVKRCEANRAKRQQQLGDMFSESQVLWDELFVRYAKNGTRSAAQIYDSVQQTRAELIQLGYDKAHLAMHQNLMSWIDQASFTLPGFFSLDVPIGKGFYPFLSTLRQSTDMNQVNACIIFEESSANLYPIKDLVKDDEITILSTGITTPPISLLAPITRKVTEGTRKVTDYSSHNTWNQLACVGARLGLKAIEQLIQKPCTEIREALKNFIAKYKRTFATVPIKSLDLARYEFLQIAIDYVYPKKKSGKPSRFPHPSIVGPTVEHELCVAALSVASGRLSISDLMSALRHDAAAVGWQKLWFEKKQLGDLVSQFMNQLADRHGDFISGRKV